MSNVSIYQLCNEVTFCPMKWMLFKKKNIHLLWVKYQISFSYKSKNAFINTQIMYNECMIMMSLNEVTAVSYIKHQIFLFPLTRAWSCRYGRSLYWWENAGKQNVTCAVGVGEVLAAVVRSTVSSFAPRELDVGGPLKNSDTHIYEQSLHSSLSKKPP